MMPRCSSKIFIPMRIKMMPPANSAFDLYFTPNTLPIDADKRNGKSGDTYDHSWDDTDL